MSCCPDSRNSRASRYRGSIPVCSVALSLACSSVAALPEAAWRAVPLFPARYETDKGWIQSFDWSRDGRRLATSMGRWVASPGSAYTCNPELWVADLNYTALSGSEQASLLNLSHLPSGAAAYASWAPSVEAANCDRLAFVRSGGIWLAEAPREGFLSRDCATSAPTTAGGKGADAMDCR